MHIFVTVGSTSFDQLVEETAIAVLSNANLRDRCSSVCFQIGCGKWPNVLPPRCTDVEIVRFVDDFQAYVKIADLIITHAGAGSILEGLSANKKVIAVPNDALMHQHQSELADALAKRGNIMVSPVTGISNAIARAAEFAPVSLAESALPKFGLEMNYYLASNLWKTP